MGSFVSSTIDRILSKRQSVTLVLGLEGAGKSTFMSGFDKLEQVPIDVVSDQMYEITARKYKNKTMIFTAIDIKGLWLHSRMMLIRAYFKNLDSLIWIIDANDRDNIHLSYQQFQMILSEMKLNGIHNKCHVLLLANKCDVPTAMNLNEIKDKMGMIRNIPIHEELFYSLRYETMLKYLPDGIFGILIEYLQSCQENGPCINIKPLHFHEMDVPFKDNDKILQIICDYLPNVVYNDTTEHKAQYETLGIIATIGFGFDQAIEWLFNAQFIVE